MKREEVLEIVEDKTLKQQLINIFNNCIEEDWGEENCTMIFDDIIAASQAITELKLNVPKFYHSILSSPSFNNKVYNAIDRAIVDGELSAEQAADGVLGVFSKTFNKLL